MAGMDVPEPTFLKKLNEKREKANNGKEDFPNPIAFGNSELNSTYFPYTTRIARAILRDKHVMFIGDSLIRAMYKDMLALIQTGELCHPQQLRVSNEDSVFGDKQFDFIELTANRVFRQAREFQSNRHLIQYYFTNRAMRDDLEKTCLMMEASEERPDVLVVNSAIWDISRFPARHFQRRHDEESELKEEIGVAEEYFNRISMFCRRMRVLLPPASTLVWVIMPVSGAPDIENGAPRGFFGYNKLTYQEIRTRLLDANARAAQIVREAGFDVLDLSFHMRLSSYQVFRIKDGVHWNVVATRFMTQLLLGHLSGAWRIQQSVMNKWSQGIKDSVAKTSNTFTRSEFLDQSLMFLKQMNGGKHMNEKLHQKLRSVVLHNYDSDLQCRTGKVPIEHLIQTLRVFLLFHKFETISSKFSNNITSAFQNIPPELSRCSQEDIQKMAELVEMAVEEWKDKEVSIVRLGYCYKRKALLLNEHRSDGEIITTEDEEEEGTPGTSSTISNHGSNSTTPEANSLSTPEEPLHVSEKRARHTS